jgi:hypothetical protein
MNKNVLVYGAYGHTGRFVVTELLRRGLTPILSGRDPVRLKEMGGGHQVRPASAGSLDDAVRDAAVVVNCAGPFLDTAIPVATAAARAGAHYLDVTAEQGAVQEVYRAGWRSDIALIPAMAFYGGLADLLATSAGWDAAEEITVVIGLDSWWPTEGTRKTGRRNTATRLIVRDGRLVPVPGQAQHRAWEFPVSLGRQTVTLTPFSETITMSRHLTASSIETFLNARALEDIGNPDTPAPRAADETGRSAQRFVVDVVLRRGEEERRITAAGRDIYAVSAPLVAEAALRLIDGRAKVSGAAAPGEVFDAADFLDALSPEPLAIRY